MGLDNISGGETIHAIGFHAVRQEYWHMEWELAWRGQRPDSTLKREDLPQPLGPITSTERPVGTSKVSSLTSGVPSGAFRATLHCTSLMPQAGCTTLLTAQHARWQDLAIFKHHDVLVRGTVGDT